MNKSLIFPIILLALLVSGCRESAQTQETPTDLDIQLEITPDPATVGESTLIVTVRDGDGAPVENAEIDIRGDMNHAGMMPVLRDSDDVSHDEAGVYRIPFEWTMGGEWFVVVTVKLTDEIEITKEFDLSVVSGS